MQVVSYPPKIIKFHKFMPFLRKKISSLTSEVILHFLYYSLSLSKKRSQWSLCFHKYVYQKIRTGLLWDHFGKRWITHNTNSHQNLPQRQGIWSQKKQFRKPVVTKKLLENR